MSEAVFPAQKRCGVFDCTRHLPGTGRDPLAEYEGGHIPGAANVPWGQAVKEDGTFKSAEDLKKLYASAGVDGSRPIITYCRIGERSSHTWFALSKILGYSVKNYDGSWTEYGNAVGVPITNPAGTIWAAK